jgi:hypothetical protein
VLFEGKAHFLQGHVGVMSEWRPSPSAPLTLWRNDSLHASSLYHVTFEPNLNLNTEPPCSLHGTWNSTNRIFFFIVILIRAANYPRSNSFDFSSNWTEKKIVSIPDNARCNPQIGHDRITSVPTLSNWNLIVTQRVHMLERTVSQPFSTECRSEDF